MATVSSIKADMLTLLGGGANWCKGSNARDSSDFPCPVFSAGAVKYDVYGALLHATRLETDHVLFHAVYEDLKSKIPGTYKSHDMEAYNDDVNWADILTMLS